LFRFGIDDIDYMQSLTKCQPEALGESPGRSGARFYHSYDHFLLLKTLTSEEVEQMHSLIKSYYPYVVERHGKTLLPQYLGMYRITVEGNEIYLVVMRNILSASLPIHKKYDLKGSTVEREASEKEKEKPLPTFKDNDFVKDAVLLHLTSRKKDEFLEILEADCEFLAKMNLMDYSLCLGIHDCEKYDQEAMECAASTNAYSEEDEGESSGGNHGSLPCVPSSPNAAASAGDVPEVPTPPDSPHLHHKSSNASEIPIPGAKGTLDPNKDIYAIESNPGRLFDNLLEKQCLRSKKPSKCDKINLNNLLNR